MTKLFAIVGILALSACGGGSSSSGGAASTPAGNAELVGLHDGLLVDVYGLRDIDGDLTFGLYQTDVLVGPDIRDERQSGEVKPDSSVLYDFISANPDNLQPRLFIPRDIESREFQDAFDALDDAARVIAPAQFGQTASDTAFSVVPRNAGIRLTFARGLGIDEEFFVERDEDGRIVGIRNAEAVQLLKIVGDPTDDVDAGDFEVIPTRIAFPKDQFGNVAQPNQLILDPVLLGSEGLQYQTRNNASGMPEAPDQIGANIRVAVALEGPLRIPGIREDRIDTLSGTNNSGSLSVIRDMRSGNREDDSADISRGFIRDAIPPKIVGQIRMILERVDEVDDFTQEITIFKADKTHEIDLGDVFRFLEAGDITGIPVAVSEVLVDPIDDQGRPDVQHVRVRVRRVPKVTNDQGILVDPLESLDPSNDPGFPQDIDEREDWLVLNAARAVLVSEFTASRFDPLTENTVRDDPRNFITFSPTPLPLADGTPSPPSLNVSPFAGAIIRFTKPVDLTTVSTTDSFYFATRNLLDPEGILAFQAAEGRGTGSKAMDPSSFRMAKFRTPHLIASRLFDQDGSQTTLRLQPILGFFLDKTVREDDELDFEEKKYNYYLHLLSGLDGITDLSGNPVDLQAETVEESNQIVFPFSLDTRMRNAEESVFPDNIVANVVRSYADTDEDEQPSYYQNDEVQGLDGTLAVKSTPLADIFGAVSYLPDGTLLARPTARSRQIVDNLNQPAPPAQNSQFKWCPRNLMTFGFAGNEAQVAANTAAVPFGAGIQNPLNPFGCRLQTVWREIDMGLSRLDPFDFNLDVEQMYWAPFSGRTITFDEFDRVTLFLGHSERRPEPCVGAISSLPSMPTSGLQSFFDLNYLHNQAVNGRDKESAPEPHPAYVDANLVIEASQAFNEPNGLNRYMPLPTFQEPYFVWRDETVVEQGGSSVRGLDIRPTGMRVDFEDYIISPFLGGQGHKAINNNGTLDFNQGTWNNALNWNIDSDGRTDGATDGLMGAIALPLLADFWTYCDSPSLPAGNGFIAQGTNGWQISITVQSSPAPLFRAYSAGFAGFEALPAECVDPGSPKWGRAAGGFTPQGMNTALGDNSLYWIMADFLKRTTVVTAGFVEISNPHRIPGAANLNIDPRLGPYFRGFPPTDVSPNFTHDFQPALESLPGGTSVAVEFRGAGIVDPIDPAAEGKSGAWRAIEEGYNPGPNSDNFPLDPFKAGDAGIRKFDDRPSKFTGGTARNWWTYFYNRTVTTYTDNLNTLVDNNFTERFQGPFETFQPKDVKYFNWRFLMSNNVEANPPISPSIDTFLVTYRFEKVR